MKNKLKHLCHCYLVLLLATPCQAFTNYVFVPSVAPITFAQQTSQCPPLPGIELLALTILENRISEPMYFVSLSDLLPKNEALDSALLRQLDHQKDSLKECPVLCTLDKDTRNHILSLLQYSATDSLYIYDYTQPRKYAIALTTLHLVAHRSVYASKSDKSIHPDDYQLGFAIEKKPLQNIQNYTKTLVAIHVQNPFGATQLKPIQWKKTSHANFPKSIKNSSATFEKKTYQLSNTYTYKTSSHTYYLQEYTSTVANNTVNARHLFIFSNSNKKMVKERLFQDSEGISLTPLNLSPRDSKQSSEIEQWTGHLFHDEPQVVFGFEWLAFGCPQIDYLHPNKSPITIHCDNRH